MKGVIKNVKNGGKYKSMRTVGGLLLYINEGGSVQFGS